MTGPASVEEAEEQAQDADAILLDSGNPAARVKELGGTGRRHDWALSAEIVSRVSRARLPRRRPHAGERGGGDPHHRAAVGLDVCSGVRTNGRLDAEKLAQLFAAVRSLPPGTLAGSDRRGQASAEDRSGSAAVDPGATPAMRPAPPRRRY